MFSNYKVYVLFAYSNVALKHNGELRQSKNEINIIRCIKPIKTNTKKYKAIITDIIQLYIRKFVLVPTPKHAIMLPNNHPASMYLIAS